jgi:DNA replication protein DnaC
MKCPECGKKNALYSDGEWHICSDCFDKINLAEIEKTIEKRMFVCGVPKRFLSAKLSDFKKQYRTDKGLFILGPVDTGKTHLLSALCRNKILNRQSCFFVNAPEFTAILKNNLAVSHQLIDKARFCKNLFIDDLGVEQSSDFVFEVWYRIINHRYNEMSYTSVSMNTINSLDQRLFRRLRDSTELIEF